MIERRRGQFTFFLCPSKMNFELCFSQFSSFGCSQYDEFKELQNSNNHGFSSVTDKELIEACERLEKHVVRENFYFPLKSASFSWSWHYDSKKK